ncbi:DUF6458 family protein [Frankia sp. QA3]|uniref:DUF6458 family protein n=1 Tax=Frankia sp. QA3 TaxID=710111 RepID=UPI000269C6C4|nr:DUF6458 family protein [Frankia sp. QA3]EIV95191.1 hypothetical protein FraQA3DRAFT_4998 [Frankia sp. QA3]
MGIGAAILLMALGAILTFAVDVSISGLDLAVVGVVLMIAGAIGLMVDLAILAPRRRRSVGAVREVDTYDAPGAAGYRRRRTTEYYPGDERTRYQDYPPVR